ncbi:AbrB family transcriptional regulator [Azospirillum halopraeferens]|uniref:AbrB family transcriptional regulator n=1 Tax=Azospirillum halopraeferens TaxID=34010 RepID=UPI0004117654|nr:AbrB family transcriptional regulator [Azospirillum halopraeferens]
MATLSSLALTLVLAFAGGGLFHWLGLPAAWLAGAMVAVAAGGLARLPVGVPDPVRLCAFTLLGLTMGAGVTPETVDRMAAWPASLLLLAGSVVATVAVCSAYLEVVHGWDRASARFAAIPGALSAVLATAAATRADLPRVALVQSLRLFVLVAAMPWVLEGLSGGTAPAAGAAAGAHVTGPADLAVLAIACAAGAYAFHRLRVPGDALLGAMLVSAVLHATGLVEGRPPAAVLAVGFVTTGAVIGARFRGVAPARLLADLRPGLESVALALAVSAAFAAAGAAWLDLPFGQFWLAYAPGGVEAMTVVTFALGYDVAFVGTHHVVRFLGIGLTTPWWTPRRRAPSGG